MVSTLTEIKQWMNEWMNNCINTALHDFYGKFIQTYGQVKIHVCRTQEDSTDAVHKHCQKITQNIPLIRAEVINAIIDQTETTHGTPSALQQSTLSLCVCIRHKVKERQCSVDELL